MKPENDRTLSARTGQPAPRKRFRLDRLEERIAPKKGGNGTKNCGGGGSNAASDSIIVSATNY